MDDIQDALEHEAFMNSLRRITENIWWLLLVTPPDVHRARDMWYDIHDYGDEPAFASIIFDRMVEEYEFSL